MSSWTTSSSAVSSEISCSLNAVGQANGSYQVDISIINTGTSVTNGWRLVLELPAGHSISNLWNAQTLSQTGTSVILGNLDWNKAISPGMKVSAGAIISGSGSTAALKCATGEATNRPPVAHFGLSTSGATVHAQMLNASDPDGQALTYTIDFGDGKVIRYQDAWHSYKVPGTYTVTQTVSDGITVTQDRRQVVVGEAQGNRAPVAIFAYNAANGTLSASAAGSTDRDGDTLIYDWDFGFGGTSQNSPQMSGKTTGLVTLTVFDGELGDTYQESVSAPPNFFVDVQPIPEFSVAIAGLSVTVDASASRLADGFSWDFGDGTRDEGMFASHTYAAPGQYIVTLKESGRMMSATKTRSITILGDEGNLPPVLGIACGVSTAYYDDFVNYVSTIIHTGYCDFRGSFDPEGANLTYSVNWGSSSSAISRQDGTSFRADFGNSYPSQPVTVSISDGVNTVSKTGTLSELRSLKPLVELVCTEDLDADGQRYITRCDASGSSDPSGLQLTYKIEWGDRNLSSSATPLLSHSYATAGDYKIVLTVSNGATFETRVLDWTAQGKPNQPPVACFDIKPVGTDTVQLSAACSSDPDGQKLLYSWDDDYGLLTSLAVRDRSISSPGTYHFSLTVDDGLTQTTLTKDYVHNPLTSRCEFKITNAWSGGYSAWLRIHNEGTATLSNWAASLQFPGSDRISSSWNGQVTGTNPYAIAPFNWNAAIAPNAYAEVGFTVWSSGSTPQAPTIGGRSCTGAD